MILKISLLFYLDVITQKVEELTLYMLQLQNQIDELKKKMYEK